MDPTPDFSPVSPSRPSREWSEVVLALGLIAGLVILFSLKIDGASGPPEMEGEEMWLRRIVRWFALGAEAAGGLVIGWGVIQALGSCVLQITRRDSDHVDSTEGVRLRLGRTLALGIEFTLAADILSTAVAPTRDELLTLGVVVLLRTLLNLFLEREISQGEAKRADARSAPEFKPAES